MKNSKIQEGKRGISLRREPASTRLEINAERA
jgi:hypothetical protein